MGQMPIEIQESSPQFQNFVIEESNKVRKVDLDMLMKYRNRHPLTQRL